MCVGCCGFFFFFFSQASQTGTMALFESEPEFLAFSSALLLLLLNSQRALQQCLPIGNEDLESDLQELSLPSHLVTNSDVLDFSAASLHTFRLWNVFMMFDADLGYWVKPRSTTWFSRFLLEEYGQERWITMFRMTKPAVLALSDLLGPHVKRQDTKYRLAIPALVRVALTLFKLTQGASLLVCSEMFAVGKSTCYAIMRGTVRAINEVLRHEISWPTGERLRQTQYDFQQLCGLPAVAGAIDGTHINISRPRYGAEDYFYFKSGGYSLNCQAVVDSKKRFLDLYLGMPGSTNDARVLRRSTLYHLGMSGELWDARNSIEGFSPYLLGDSGYPLLSWLMVPHRNTRNFIVLERLYNKKLRTGRCIVENAFGILKQTFRELLVKSDLHVVFLPDVITCCAILHNVLLGQSHDEVEHLMQVLRNEGLNGEVVDEDIEPPEVDPGEVNNVVALEGDEQRERLAIYLAARRNM
jgi:hypothetical protein